MMMKLKYLKRRLRFNKKRSYFFLFLFLLVCSVGLGYAAISTTLSIDGSAQFKDARWNVYFDNLNVTTGSITATTPASITNTTTVSFGAKLENPGDFYEFTVDVVNGGNMNAMIDSFNILPELSVAQQNYLSYIVTYSDGVALASKQKLDVGATETLKVRFEYLENADASLYPTEDDNLTIAFDVTYVQADNTAVKVPHAESFADDDWDIVINTLTSGNISPYEVGDEKEVDLGTLGVHKLRIANSTTPEECSTEGFSQTACGVVLEFVDIITAHRMNPYNDSDTTTIGLNSKGGWEYSDMRAYLNSTTYAYENIDYSTTGIYSSLPEVIKNAIIDTTVVSGHNSNDTTNFTSTDKLYLLSTHEVWEDVDGNTSSGIDRYDTAYNNTRQLDYYKGLNVTTSNYSSAIKKNGTTNSSWWLRSANSSRTNSFNIVYANGRWNGGYASNTNGVSPAFRIA